MTSGNHIVDQHEAEERRRDKADRCPCGCKRTEEVVICDAATILLRCEGYNCRDYIAELPVLMRIWHWLFKTEHFLDCPNATVADVCAHCGDRRP